MCISSTLPSSYNTCLHCLQPAMVLVDWWDCCFFDMKTVLLGRGGGSSQGQKNSKKVLDTKSFLNFSYCVQGVQGSEGWSVLPQATKPVWRQHWDVTWVWWKSLPFEHIRNWTKWVGSLSWDTELWNKGKTYNCCLAAQGRMWPGGCPALRNILASFSWLGQNTA